jgi:hypothetical protein
MAERVIIPVMFSTRLPIIRSTSALPAPPPPAEPNPFGKVIWDYTIQNTFKSFLKSQPNPIFGVNIKNRKKCVIRIF